MTTVPLETLRDGDEAYRLTFDIALDPEGGAHLFIARRVDDVLDEPRVALIEHVVIARGAVEHLDPIRTERSMPSALRATNDPNGAIHVFWAEGSHEAGYHRQVLYLQSWSNDSWGPRQMVLDAKGRVVGMTESDLFVSATTGGIVDLYWNDWRESNFWSGLISMGDGANWVKTYWRRIDSAGAGPVGRVQKKGRFLVTSFAPYQTSAAQDHAVFWARGHSKRVQLMRSSYSEGKWQKPDRVAECRSPMGRALISDVDALAGDNGEPRVGWMCLCYEPEADPSRNTAVSRLYLSTRAHGEWTTGPPLSKGALGFKWAWIHGASTGILLEESSGLGRTAGHAHAHGKLSLVELVNGVTEKTHTVSQHPVMKGWRALTTGHGVHLVYLEYGADDNIAMKYARFEPAEAPGRAGAMESEGR